MSIALIFSLSLFISITLVPFFMKHAVTLGLVDLPDGIRKIHTQVIPRSGGIAIVIATLTPVFIIARLTPELNGLVIGAVIITVFGLLDDRFDLNYKWKFIGQILAILVFILTFGDINKVPFFLENQIPLWLQYVFLFVFMLGATNAVNLSDGLDGLAAGTMLLSISLIAYLAYDSNIFPIVASAMALFGSLIGFLRYNTHPARVFMGDTGSQFIGFLTAALAVCLTQNTETAISPILPLLILGLPILDTIMVMSIRIYKGRSPFSPDKNHIHHQLIKIGFVHYQVVAIIYLIQIFLISVTYLCRYQSDIAILGIYILFSAAFLIALYFIRSNNWRLPNDKENPGFVERRNPVFRKLSWVHVHSAYLIGASLAICWFLLTIGNYNWDGTIRWLSVAVLVLSFLAGLIVPKQSLLSIRIATYGVSVLALYPYWIGTTNSFMSDELINLMLLAIGLLLILSIRVTRREDFNLDNRDILVLVLLLAGAILPVATNHQLDFSTMLIRISVLLYAIEYLMNKKTKHTVILYIPSVISLFVLAFA